jgi:hypothetical protein
MRFDELFKNLGYIAGTIGSQMRDSASTACRSRSST